MDELLKITQPNLVKFFFDKIFDGFYIVVGGPLNIFDVLGLLNAEIQQSNAHYLLPICSALIWLN